MKSLPNHRPGSAALARGSFLASGTPALISRRPARARRTPPGEPLNSKPLRVLDETIRAAQLGDAAAFETLYGLHSRRVYSLCLRMVGDPVDAEDLTQEAFMQLFRKIHTFRGESAFSSWLHRLTANIVLMRFRKKTPAMTSLDEILREDDEHNRPKLEIGVQDPQLAGLIDRLNLNVVVDQLPEGYKLMFILHDVHGYEHNEIAAILGCSVGNSKSQLHKARKRLRELLHRASRNIRAPLEAARPEQQSEDQYRLPGCEAVHPPELALTPAV
jgi:RNA polymerase sigma-70 factor, ECF subfamily